MIQRPDTGNIHHDVIADKAPKYTKSWPIPPVKYGIESNAYIYIPLLMKSSILSVQIADHGGRKLVTSKTAVL